jgi:hypothetical protein
MRGVREEHSKTVTSVWREKFSSAFAKLLAGLEEKRRMLDMARARR